MFSCPKFIPHALNSSTVLQRSFAILINVVRKAWGVYCGQLHHGKSGADDLVKRGRGGVWITQQSHLLKPACFRQPHLGLGEQSIGVTKELFRAQLFHPCRETFQISKINRHEHGVDVFGGLGVYLMRVLEHFAMKQVDMFEPEGRHGPHTRPCKHEERKQRLVPPVKLRRAGHGLEGVECCLRCRALLVVGGMGNACRLSVVVEVARIAIGQRLFVTRLPGQPVKELAHKCQGGIHRRMT